MKSANRIQSSSRRKILRLSGVLSSLLIASLFSGALFSGCEKEPVGPEPVDPVEPVDSVPSVPVVDSVRLKGVVSNDPFLKFPSAEILARHERGDTLAFGVTDSKGEYSLVFEKDSGSYDVVVNSFGHFSVVKSFSDWKDRSLDFSLPVIPDTLRSDYGVLVKGVQLDNLIKGAGVVVRSESGSLLLEGVTDVNGFFNGSLLNEFVAYEGDTIRSFDKVVSSVSAVNFHDKIYSNDFSKNVSLEARLAQIAEVPGGSGTRIRLYDVESGLVSPGFVLFGDDLVSVPTGEIELFVPRGQGFLETRLANPYDHGLVWGFIRRTNLAEFSAGEVVNALGVSYNLYNKHGVVKDSLYVEGHSSFVDLDERNMSPYRFQRFARFVNFEASVGGGGLNPDGSNSNNHLNSLARWGSSLNGFLPDEFIIYDTLIGANFVNNEWIPVVHTMSEQMKQANIDFFHGEVDPVVSPNRNDVSVIIKNVKNVYDDPLFEYHAENRNKVHISPRNNLLESINATGTIYVKAEPFGNVYYSGIGYQTNPDPDRHYYKVIAHEVYSALLGTTHRVYPWHWTPENRLARFDESVLYTSNIITFPSLYDMKILRVVYSPNSSFNPEVNDMVKGVYRQGEPYENILGLPENEKYY